MNSEEAATAKLKARYLDGETAISSSSLGDVVISNPDGVELEVFDLLPGKPAQSAEKYTAASG